MRGCFDLPFESQTVSEKRSPSFSFLIISLSVTIRMKVVEHFFPVIFKPVGKTLKMKASNEKRKL